MLFGVERKTEQGHVTHEKENEKKNRLIVYNKSFTCFKKIVGMVFDDFYEDEWWNKMENYVVCNFFLTF